MFGKEAGGGARRFVDPLGAEVVFDGTSPIGWYLAANVLVVRDGKVLMVRQPPQWGGGWELPGGGVEANEALLEAAVRECHEETGYRFVASSPAPIHVEEAWFGGRRSSYAHAVIFVFEGDVDGNVDPEWTQDHAPPTTTSRTDRYVGAEIPDPIGFLAIRRPAGPPLKPC